jgi:hypothetical protein
LTRALSAFDLGTMGTAISPRGDMLKYRVQPYAGTRHVVDQQH